MREAREAGVFFLVTSPLWCPIKKASRKSGEVSSRLSLLLKKQLFFGSRPYAKGSLTQAVSLVSSPLVSVKIPLLNPYILTWVWHFHLPLGTEFQLISLTLCFLFISDTLRFAFIYFKFDYCRSHKKMTFLNWAVLGEFNKRTKVLTGKGNHRK